MSIYFILSKYINKSSRNQSLLRSNQVIFTLFASEANLKLVLKSEDILAFKMTVFYLIDSCRYQA